MEAWVRDILACPRDRGALRSQGAALVCAHGHAYPVIDGIPVLLVAEARQTHWVADLALAATGAPPEPAGAAPEAVDRFVQEAVGATSGYLYGPLINRLTEYPIPELDPAAQPGQRFLEVGCNWGRWCIAAARAGYEVLGVDPSLDAVLAARRVTRSVGLVATYVVADGRYLPLADESVDVAFSYGVLQHFAREDARAALGEMRRVMRPRGRAEVQMANALGVRSLYHQLRRGFRRPVAFEVRYWTPRALRSAFEEHIGPTRVFAHSFFSLNALPSDARMLRARHRLVVRASDLLRRAAGRVPGLSTVADSLYLVSRKGPGRGGGAA